MCPAPTGHDVYWAAGHHFLSAKIPCKRVYWMKLSKTYNAQWCYLLRLPKRSHREKPRSPIKEPVISLSDACSLVEAFWQRVMLADIF